MTDRSNRNTEYVLVQDSKSRKPARYYYVADDDNDSQADITTRKIVQTKPAEEQRIRYVTTDELEPDYRRMRLTESTDRLLKIRHANTGEQIILDEDDNIIKIIRNNRSRSPSLVENRQHRSRPRGMQPLYYETSDGRLIARPSKNHLIENSKGDFVYAEDEPTKIVRKVILDPRTGNQQTVYEKDKPKKIVQKRYIIRKRTNNPPVDSDNDPQQISESQEPPQYVHVVQRRVVPTQEEPTTKYVMIRKKVDSEPVQTVVSSEAPTKAVRRIVYQTAPKKSPLKYVYASNGKYYK